ncbi:MAG: tRNA 2-thiouridine(34) synthase MnmA [Candidatus Microthrix parvicella]
MSAAPATERVLMAMSGGVDSSVAAAELVESGVEVVGVTLKLWGGESDSGCCSVSDVDDARRVADALGIEHLVFALGDDFERAVGGPYVEAHAQGRTPNPCVECNRHIKFDKLLRRARALGFDAVATGHHAQIVSTLDGPRLARGADDAKDQSYVLHMLSADDLARTRFPIGHLTKDEVRRRADALGMRTAHKPDSQDVCFITRADGRRAFLERRIDLTPGRVVTADGAEVGTVPALELITPGQRKGLGLPGGGRRRYATAVDLDAGTVTVGFEADLEVTALGLSQPTWAGGSPPERGARVQVQTAAHGAVRNAAWDGNDRVVFDRPERYVASGQSVVLYSIPLDGNAQVVLGGGIAEQAPGP